MSDWIDFNEQKPEESGTFLVYTREAKVYLVIWDLPAPTLSRYLMVRNSSLCISRQGVTHWMPLPAPPSINTTKQTEDYNVLNIQNRTSNILPYTAQEARADAHEAHRQKATQDIRQENQDCLNKILKAIKKRSKEGNYFFDIPCDWFNGLFQYESVCNQLEELDYKVSPDPLRPNKSEDPSIPVTTYVSWADE